MFGITDLSTYIIALVAIVLLPGPNSLFVLTVGAKRGRVAGYKAAFGVFTGDAILMCLAATGGAALLKSNPAVFAVVKVLGASYLGYLALRLLWAAFIDLKKCYSPPEWQTNQQQPTLNEQSDLNHPFKKAMVISLLNPKAILFFVSFFIQFVDPLYPYPALSFLILGALAETFSFIYLSILIFSGEYFSGVFRNSLRLRVAGLGSVGILFLGFAAKLATAHLE